LTDWRLQITGLNLHQPIDCRIEDLEQWADPHIPVEKYVPQKEGEAVLLNKVITELSLQGAYTHAKFKAEDGYSQLVAIEDLASAFLLFKQGGKPLSKGFPVRLYVPAGNTDCLNVKSVVEIELINKTKS
jgi:DMSO/TMAO reductase YedYZ molybdopterin-dependent catalytic subunit